MKPKLTIDALKTEAQAFATLESAHREPALFGVTDVTDGTAVGTYFEHKFRDHLQVRFSFQEGSSAKGIDFPEFDVDMKVTSIKQPQSSWITKGTRMIFLPSCRSGCFLSTRSRPDTSPTICWRHDRISGI